MESVRMLERNETDFTLGYHHPVLTIRLDGRQFSYATVASDKLVPVSRANPGGKPIHSITADAPVPLLAYGPTLALGRLVEDYLAQNPLVPNVARRVECDSADALHEYVLRGLGIAWLPWSMVRADCKSGRMAVAGDRRMEVRFEVRLYRPKRRLHALAEAVWHSATAAILR
jgi:DNA-binding transcriptional LysR family regulator